MIETLREIALKIAGLAKFLIPVMAIFELFRYIWNRFVVDIIGGWWSALVAKITAKIRAQMEILEVDLTPPADFMAMVAKINVVIPLEEMWTYFLLYLAVASVVLGIKWARNLIPGMN